MHFENKNGLRAQPVLIKSSQPIRSSIQMTSPSAMLLLRAIRRRKAAIHEFGERNQHITHIESTVTVKVADNQAVNTALAVPTLPVFFVQSYTVPASTLTAA